jgi:hypothetical protein
MAVGLHVHCKESRPDASVGTAHSATVKQLRLREAKESSGGEEFSAQDRRVMPDRDSFLRFRAISRPGGAGTANAPSTVSVAATCIATALEKRRRRSVAAAAHDVCHQPWRKALLLCGIASSVLYALMIWAIRYEGYDAISQVPSELDLSASNREATSFSVNKGRAATNSSSSLQRRRIAASRGWRLERR